VHHADFEITRGFVAVTDDGRSSLLSLAGPSLHPFAMYYPFVVLFFLTALAGRGTCGYLLSAGCTHTVD
jgi:hypothetical protein